MNKTQHPTSFGEFVFFLPYLEDDCRNKDLDILNKAEKPKYLFGEPTMDSLNMITFGVYSDLCDVLQNEDHIELIRNVVKTLYPDVDDERINNVPAYDMWGFASWAVKEVGRINKIFSSITVDYTDQEKRAGIENMQFGTFGILDWYAKRMGITDQEKVNSEKWVRIYQCMKNDAEETAFNRRLQNIYESDAKRHK